MKLTYTFWAHLLFHETNASNIQTRLFSSHIFILKVEVWIWIQLSYENIKPVCHYTPIYSWKT